MNDLAKRLVELDELGYWEYSVPTDDPDSVRIAPTTYSVILEVILNGRYYYREVGMHKATEAFAPDYWAGEMRDYVRDDPMRGFNLILDLNIEDGYFPRKVYFDVLQDTTSFGVDVDMPSDSSAVHGRTTYLTDSCTGRTLTLQFEHEEDAEAFFGYLERQQQRGCAWDEMVFDLIQNLTLIKEMYYAEAHDAP